MIIMLGMVNFAFLDSGTGGLPYLTYLKKKNPSASCIYIGDTKHFPYGEKTEAQIIENACGCVEKIIARWNPHTVVIAIRFLLLHWKNCAADFLIRRL